MRHHDALLEPVDLRPRIRYTRVQLKTGILFFSTTSWRVSFERYTEMGRRIRPFDRARHRLYLRPPRASRRLSSIELT